ncbi:hypothetical protein CIW52_06635 [Mycolicibacterium sp. P9-64]|uniref:hypothetical protein n=1 Tax=Mycolicibacterium sp. P9-64 TaxID=2024612 RepID=UPI0011EE8D49|nr:hypothetical protein [Mycolicibacterium sp. P9-64]KAA0085568.1 hypothetical protein CIW52_06635 [Mycolicibacterium sp. P9-64]
MVVASLLGSYSPVVLDLRDWPCDVVLRVQLADAIEALTGVNGTWKSAYTARGNYVHIKEFARWCGDNNVRELIELSPNRWNTYLLHLAKSTAKNNSRRRHLGAVRQVLRRYLHRLHPDLPRSLNRRLPRRDVDESQPLDIDVYDAILEAATAAVNVEYRRIRPNLLLLKQADTEELSPQRRAQADALRELAGTGAPQTDAGRSALGITVRDKRSSGVAKGRPMLFVSYEGAVAIAVLIACLEGVNFTQINERKVPSGAPGLGTAEDVLTVEDEKRRRRSDQYDAHAIPKNARRAMMKIVEMTQPARNYLAAHDLPGADRVIVYWPARGGGATPQVGLRPTEVYKSYRLGWWPNADVLVSFQRIRKTVRVLIDRTPQGHSRATWSTLYVAASEVERERLMAEAVETGLWAVIENAEAHLKMRFERAVTPTDTDTTIGGCVDFEHHPSTGEPCGDDFLLCLRCTHAFATPRHLPRLIELRHQLEAIASTDGPDWTDFRAMAYGCLLALIEDRTLITAYEYRAAEDAVTDEDRTEINLLLNGKYV